MIKKTKPNISVILSVYNKEPFIRQCLDSIVNQDMQNIEIICVDDGSTDNSLSILREYEKQDKRIRIISGDHKNAGAARNKGIDIASGKYLFFPDADDFCDLSLLSETYKAAEGDHSDVVLFKSKRLDCSTGKISPCSFSLFSNCLPQKRPFSINEIDGNFFRYVMGWAWDKLFKRELIFRNCLRFQEQRTTNDLFFVYMSLIKANAITILDKELYTYRYNVDDSLSSTRIESWDCFYHALSLLKEKLIQLELYELYKSKFIDYSLHLIIDNFSIIPNGVDKNVYIKRVVEWSRELDIKSSPRDFFTCDGEYMSYMDILSKSGESNGMSDLKTLISIIIPVYNDGKYLRDCIESARNQSLTDIEIIVVNDASIDDSEDIIQYFSQLDKRIISIRFAENQSAYMARKAGINAAHGKYIMFLDGDDYLDLDACLRVSEIMESEAPDILHFSTNVIIEDGLNINTKKYKELIDPKDIKLYGGEIFRSFIDNGFEGHLWNKAFKADLLKTVMKDSCDRILPKAQDKFVYWMTSFFAKSYLGCPRYSLYNYRYGAGLENTKNLSIELFEKFCKQVWVEDEIEIFMQRNATYSFDKDIKKSRYNLLAHCVKQWQKLSDDDMNTGFELMARYWNRSEDYGEIVGNFCKLYKNNEYDLISKLQGSFCALDNVESIKTIGTYYPKFGNGGIQKVMQKLATVWMDCGYKVVIFTDYESEDDYDVPNGVERVVLSNPGNLSAEHYYNRGREWDKALRDYGIDMMVYHSYLGPALLWDLITTRLNGIPYVIYYHNTFSKYLLANDSRFISIPRISSLASAVCVLSRTDKIFFESFCSKVFLVYNPMQMETVKNNENNLINHNIIWVGRLDELHKQFDDAVDIMKLVLKEKPDAKLFIVGKDDEGKQFIRLKKRITKLKLEDSIILCGYQKDVDSFYEVSSVYLMTSSHEGSPMTLIEALCHGLPVVMYDLPYMETVRGNDGIISVPMRDAPGAAKAINQLLDDYQYRREIGKRGKEFIQNMSLSYDLKGIWINIFSSCINNCQVDNSDEEMRILFNTILNAFGTNLLVQKKEKEQLYNRVYQLSEHNQTLMKHSDQMDEIKKELNYANYCIGEIRKSKSYKIGLAITWVPRKVRAILKGGNNK